MRKILIAFVALAVLAIPSTAFAAGAGGVTDGAAFYVDGVEYRTVGTPTDLTGTKAPAHTFDTLYAIEGQALAVSEAAPGDTDYNGGRWQVHAISIADYGAAIAMFDANGSGDFDSAEEVEAALAYGAAIDNGVVASFVCPVIQIP